MAKKKQSAESTVLASAVSAQGSEHPAIRKGRAESAAKPTRWTISGTNVGVLELTIIVIAVLVFIIGVFVSQAAQPPDAYPILDQSCLKKTPGARPCEMVITSLHEGTHTFEKYGILEAIAEALKALSVAVVVTVGVAAIIEHRNRDKLNAALTEKAEKIANNVFDGLFGNDHSPRLLETLKEHILNKSIVRDSLTMRYTLRDHMGRNKLAGQRFTMLKAQVTAEFTNISTTAGSNSPLPLELSLPNPLLTELKKMVKLHSVVIRQSDRPEMVLTQDQIDEANARLYASLSDNNALEGIVQFGDLDLGPGETGGFEIQYTMMKEAEDSELLRSFHTTSALSLTVIDHTDRNLFIRAKAIHPGTLKLHSDEDSVSEWSLNDIILPQQGILIWWKERPPSRASKGRKPPAKFAAAEAAPIDEERP